MKETYNCMYIIHREATLYHISWNTDTIKYLSRKPIDTVSIHASPYYSGVITIRVIPHLSLMLFTYHWESLTLFTIFRCDKKIHYIYHSFEHRIYNTFIDFKNILLVLIRLSLLSIKDTLICMHVNHIRLYWFHFKDEFI